MVDDTKLEEIIAFHAHGTTHRVFEEDLEKAINLVEWDGHQVVGISHAVAMTTNGDGEVVVMYSAVVWGQNEVGDDER